jgi:hypothetical protein
MKMLLSDKPLRREGSRRTFEEDDEEVHGLYG